MPSNILANGNTALASTDIPLASGESAVIGIRPIANAPGAPGVRVEILDDAGGYHAVGEVTLAAGPRRIDGPVTFRVVRAAGVSCGVYRG